MAGRGGDSAEFQTSNIHKSALFFFKKKKKREENHSGELLPFPTENRGSKANIDTVRRREKKDRRRENQVNTGKQYRRRNTASTCTQQAKLQLSAKPLLNKSTGFIEKQKLLKTTENKKQKAAEQLP